MVGHTHCSWLKRPYALDAIACGPCYNKSDIPLDEVQ